MNFTRVIIFLMLLTTTIPTFSEAQFLDHFNDQQLDQEWFHMTGDGDITMDFVQQESHAQIQVDATRDRHNVWWAIIKRSVSPNLDLSRLQNPANELRVEARVRVSHAPRRLNFMVNTQRTTNFHKQLMEYDIPDTTGWHTISMTTDDLDAKPGDTLYVQLGVTDWGRGSYHVDLDYYRADIINVNEAGSDKGELVPYHPPIPEPDHFSIHLEASHDGLVNTEFPDVNFSDWQATTSGGTARVLTVSANQWAVLRWDFDEFKKAKVAEAGILELTSHSVAGGGNYIEAYGQDLGMEFGKIRVIEILGGDPDWQEQTVTYNSLVQGNPYAKVFNGQMIYDVEPVKRNNGKTRITISKPVLQRMLNGTTKGLLIRPLGALDFSFYATEANLKQATGPALHFTLSSER